jgi:hypothetical protein
MNKTIIIAKCYTKSKTFKKVSIVIEKEISLPILAQLQKLDNSITKIDWYRAYGVNEILTNKN